MKPHVEIRGHDGPALLLVHGWGRDHRTWRALDFGERRVSADAASRQLGPLPGPIAEQLAASAPASRHVLADLLALSRHGLS
ncbi:hypothetical protein AB0H88_03295 [Nonomuraea sp. NPDC050680]|uniref:alpha/beta fold hydrolase n=1 Tax=Nonomuraea sp. NPDC050680 TaxID=3154630 RepID=UPI00340E29A5